MSERPTRKRPMAKSAQGPAAAPMISQKVAIGTRQRQLKQGEKQPGAGGEHQRIARHGEHDALQDRQSVAAATEVELDDHHGRSA